MNLPRETYLEINTEHLAYNVKAFKEMILPNTRILANLKGNAYGTDAVLVGKFLEKLNIDYFSVAYINEGIRLREEGIKANLLVFNPSIENFQALVDYHLEPEVSSLNYLNKLVNFFKRKGIKNFPVHIKLDTGMHRAGIEFKEIDKLIEIIKNNSFLRIQSVFSHLAAAEDPNEDEFTLNQIKIFESLTRQLKQSTNLNFFRHILNTAGTFRFPQFQFDMIRPGLGIYGYNTVENPSIKLKPVARLLTKINQIKTLKAGDSVGYNRKHRIKKETKIALLPIGYADGLRRKLGNQNWQVKVKGKLAPIVGNISMDTLSIDVSEINCKAGDEVIIFDNEQDIYKLAHILETIPYEIITSVTRRVPRILE